MNKKQQARRLKRLNQNSKLRKQAQQDDDLLEDEVLDEEDEALEAESEDKEGEADESVDEAEKSIRKDMYAPEANYPTGPTSFAELDATREAMKKAEAVRQLGWDVNDLVRNILYHPMMNPKEKSNAIREIGNGFEERVGTVMEDVTEKDLDVLSIEAVLARDLRHTGMMERIGDFVAKKTLTSQARGKLSESAFALPGKRKYPIHDKAHVRNALARAAQQMKAGGEGAADAKAALPKIRAAAKKFGIETSMEKDSNAIVIEKDAQGDWRWVGWASNKFIDLDGEILSDAAHKEFLGWLDENPDLSPVFLSWHTPDTMRKSAVDFWAYENGFLIYSGKLTEEEAASLLRVQKDVDLGMSHGSMVLERDPQNKKIITKYRMFEVSELPIENAANPFTNFDTIAKEAGMNKMDYLTSLIGEERAKAIMKKSGEAEKALTEAGVANKQASEPETPKTEKPVTPLKQDELVAQIVKQVGEHYDMAGLNEFLTEAKDAMDKVQVLEELVKELSGQREDELAEMISPPGGFVWSLSKARASQNDDSKLDPENETDKKLQKSAPVLDPANDWLSVQTGTQPIRSN